MATLPYRQYVFFKKRISFTKVVFYSPLPLGTAHMVRGMGESQFIIISILSAYDTSSAVVGVQMCQENIGNIFRSVSSLFKSSDEALTAMQIYMPEKFFTLFIPPSGVN